MNKKNENTAFDYNEENLLTLGQKRRLNRLNFDPTNKYWHLTQPANLGMDKSVSYFRKLIEFQKKKEHSQE